MPFGWTRERAEAVLRDVREASDVPSLVASWLELARSAATTEAGLRALASVVPQLAYPMASLPPPGVLKIASSDDGHVIAQFNPLVIVHLGRVPTIDATGFAALEQAIATIERRGCHVILIGPLPEPRRIFDKAELEKHPLVRIAPTLDAGVAIALATVV